ncbi:MAG: lipopolysaccharide heptosyltransferase II [Pseudomonadota bacterium]
MKGLSTAPEKIVVRSTNWVGDVVMTVPALREIRRLFPKSHIALWGPRYLAELLSAVDVADEIISFDKSDGSPLLRSFRVRRRLSEGRYDMVVLLQNAFESALTAWSARIPIRVGYPTDLRGPLLSLRIPILPNIRQKHEVYYYLAIADRLAQFYGRERDARGIIPDCSIGIPPESMISARKVLDRESGTSEGPIYAFCPGSVNSEAKRWPVEHFAALADKVIEILSGRAVFLGSAGERDLVARTMSLMRSRNAVNLAGLCGMLESMALMNVSRVVVSNDTGSAHLAVAASARVLTIFGPTRPSATAPFGPTAEIIGVEAPCAPCRNYRCPVAGRPCMTELTPEMVFEKIISFPGIVAGI